MVLGGERSFKEVLEEPPGPDEDGPDWPRRETSRFARLARRLWDPVLDAADGRPA